MFIIPLLHAIVLTMKHLQSELFIIKHKSKETEVILDLIVIAYE